MMLLRRPQVEALTGLACSTIYAYVKEDMFPKQIKIGKRAVAWREADILAWIEGRAQLSGLSV